MKRFAQSMQEHREELVALDTAIGDGDHGTNMDRGMRKAIEKLDAQEQPDVGAVLKTVAMALVSSVGGAAGPLYGTLLLQMGTALAGKEDVDLETYAAAWRKGAEGVQARGKAQLGDKTMVDALIPGVEALEKASDLDSGLQEAARPPQSRECGTRSRWSHVRDGPATSGSAAAITRIPARLPPPTSIRPPPRRCRVEKERFEWRITSQHSTRAPPALAA